MKVKSWWKKKLNGLVRNSLGLRCSTHRARNGPARNAWIKYMLGPIFTFSNLNLDWIDFQYPPALFLSFYTKAGSIWDVCLSDCL